MEQRRTRGIDLIAVFGVLLLVLMTAAGAAQSRDTRTWYQAYRDAQTKIQQRNWQGALTDLDAAARAGAPRPGRNINFYGDTFGTYNPEYYRGVALANLGRYAEADAAFERVRATNLLDQKDPTYTEFVRLSASVKESVKQLAAQGASVPAAPTGLRIENTNGSQTAANSPAQTGAASTSQLPAQTGAGGVAVEAGSQPSSAQAPVQTADAKQQPYQPPAPARTTPGPKASPIPLDPKALGNSKSSAAISNQPPARVTDKEARAAIFAFYSGDYAGAVRILRPLADAGVADTRTYLYLASSQAALVLTGDTQRLATSGGAAARPADAMREAQTFAARVGDTAPYARDLALISPRIRQQLGLRQ